MPNKQLETAQHHAIRLGNMPMLIAAGETPNRNDKTDSEEIATSEEGPTAGMQPDSKANYCVFMMTGSDNQPLLIAKCDAPLPSIYSSIFGPDTHANCEKYVKDHGGERT